MGFCLRNTMVKLFSPGHRSPSEESKEEYDENKAEEETKVSLGERQGGRTCQTFGGGKHGHETFRQARNYNFRDKCVVFARNLKFSNLTQ